MCQLDLISNPTGEGETAQLRYSDDENRAYRAESKLAYHANLLRALGGDPSGWEWTGEVFESKQLAYTCACGHIGLRYLYMLRKPGHQNVGVGSSCILNYRGVDQSLVDAIGGHVAELRRLASERRSAAKRAAAQAESLELIEALKAAKRKAVETVSGAVQSQGWRNVRTAYWLWKAIGNSRTCDELWQDVSAGRESYFAYKLEVRLPQYKRVSDMVRWLKTQIALWSQSPVEREY